MKRTLRWLLILVTSFVVLIGVVAGYIYFSVDDRVVIAADVIPFVNQREIKRLDSTSISEDSLSQHVGGLMEKARVHGLAMAVITNDTLVYQKYFGFKNKDKGTVLTPGTVFYGASLSKPVFGYLVAQLAGKGIIHLDTPLYKYLKRPLPDYKNNLLQRWLSNRYVDYSDLEGDERYKKITARMCLSHTTGFPNWRWLEPDGRLRFLFDPGARYRYSGEGMALLQLVIEEVTERSLDDLARSFVFDPLDMTATSYRWQRGYEENYCVGHTGEGGTLGIPKSNAANAAGSMSITLEDCTRFIHAMLRQEDAASREITSPQVRIKSKQQFGPNSMIDTDENDDIQLSYGLGFGLYFTPYGKAFFKEGHLDGWQHYTVGFPETRTAVIMMSNSESAESIFYELVEVAIGNSYTPWYWEGYTPFERQVSGKL